MIYSFDRAFFINRIKIIILSRANRSYQPCCRAQDGEFTPSHEEIKSKVPEEAIDELTINLYFRVEVAVVFVDRINRTLCGGEQSQCLTQVPKRHPGTTSRGREYRVHANKLSCLLLLKPDEEC